MAANSRPDRGNHPHIHTHPSAGTGRGRRGTLLWASPSVGSSFLGNNSLGEPYWLTTMLD